jgi:hypothetical protein
VRTRTHAHAHTNTDTRARAPQVFVADLSGVPFLKVSLARWRGVAPPGHDMLPMDVGAFRCARPTPAPHRTACWLRCAPLQGSCLPLAGRLVAKRRFTGILTPSRILTCLLASPGPPSHHHH